jgi:putative transcriptional regulator
MLTLDHDIGITTSRDILNAIATGKGPDQVLIALGYAGWGAGQLERELSENAWLTAPVDLDIMFNTPIHKRWRAAAARLGVDLMLISSEAGHA